MLGAYQLYNIVDVFSIFIFLLKTLILLYNYYNIFLTHIPTCTPSKTQSNLYIYHSHSITKLRLIHSVFFFFFFYLKKTCIITTKFSLLPLLNHETSTYCRLFKKELFIVYWVRLFVYFSYSLLPVVCLFLSSSPLFFRCNSSKTVTLISRVLLCWIVMKIGIEMDKTMNW
jgi:hypothetical protein